MNTTEISVISEPSTSAFNLVMNDNAMDRMMSAAKMMASAKVTIPKHLQNSEGDCMAVIMQAAQWKMNPFAVAQKTYLVSGILGYEAQLVHAVIQSSGAISSRFFYEYQGNGNDLLCRVGAVIRGETETTWGEWLKNGDVATKNSPLWKTNPKQQMGYLQVKNWARAYCPGAILGVYSEDEIERRPTEREINPSSRPENPANPSEPAIYADSDFNKNLPNWENVLAKGKDVDVLIEFIEKKANATLTETQKSTLRSIQLPVAESLLMASPEQMNEVRKAAEAATISWAEICAFLKIGVDEILTNTLINQALAFIADPVGNT